MNEKILTVLVVVSLVLSVFSLVLTFRSNGINAITNIVQSTSIDSATAKADSFELKILERGMTIIRNDTANNFSKEYNLTIIDVDEQTFLGELPNVQFSSAVEYPLRVSIIRCQDCFYGFSKVDYTPFLLIRYTPNSPASMSSQSRLEVFMPLLHYYMSTVGASYSELNNATEFNTWMTTLKSYNFTIIDVDRDTFFTFIVNQGDYAQVLRYQNTFYLSNGYGTLECCTP